MSRHGIGLATALSLDRLDDPALVDEVQIALDTTLREGFGHTHALCHGDVGALDVLLEASQVLGDNRWRDASHRLAGKILTSIERSGWQCGGPPGVEMPGLMLGLAGIGYGMLRLAEPAQVPCVLRLAPPLA